MPQPTKPDTAIAHDAPKSTFPVVLWIAAAFLIGLGLWAAVYWHTDGGANGPPLLVSVGNAGLTLAFGGVLGGLVKKLFDDWEARKAAAEARTAYVAQLLDDFKTVYNMVERARFLIAAHKSAKTYGEQMRNLPDAIILLHNIKRATKQGFPNLYKDIDGPIYFCTVFIKALVEEYRDAYLRVSRLQSQDEVENKLLREAIADGEVARDAELSYSGWQEISDLTQIKVLLDATAKNPSDGAHEAFQTYETAFVRFIDLASYALMLRMPGNEAGVRQPKLDKAIFECAQDAQQDRARRKAEA